MSRRGFLRGAEMANTFNMLAANDLIWSFVVNNYLLGQEPLPLRPALLERRQHAHARRACTASTCAACTSRTTW
jgi:poly(3-hydroxyalkanoate) synthetase